MDKSIIFEKIKELMCMEFKLDDESIGINKLLNEDLGLDSLDMVDFIIALKNHIGEDVNPSLFKNARTVQDIVDILQPLWKSE